MHVPLLFSSDDTETQHIVDTDTASLSGIEFPSAEYEHRSHPCADLTNFEGGEHEDSDSLLRGREEGDKEEEKERRWKKRASVAVARSENTSSSPLDVEMCSTDSLPLTLKHPDLQTVSSTVPFYHPIEPRQRKGPRVLSSIKETSSREMVISDNHTSTSAQKHSRDMQGKAPSRSTSQSDETSSQDMMEATTKAAQSESLEKSETNQPSDLTSTNEWTLSQFLGKRHSSALAEGMSFEEASVRRPRVHIRLVRAKSAFTLNSPDKENASTASVTFSDIDEMKELSTSSPDVTTKHPGYFKRMKRFLRPRSSRSSLAGESVSAEELNIVSKRNGDSKSSQKVARSSTSSNGSAESLSEDLTESQIKEKLKALTVLLEERQARQDVNGKTPEHSENDSKEQTPRTPEQSGAKNLLEPKAQNRYGSFSLRRPPHDDADSSTISFTRLPSMRKGEFRPSLLQRYSTVMPADDTGESNVIKDATNIQPLANGEAVVTDLLSNKMVLFDVKGFPRITFAVEVGSEPWATCMTQDGALAVTLKRQGCVTLWSTAGEPIVEFGQHELVAPTGIQCDQKGRFVVADEEANSVSIFNKRGEFLTELIGPDTPSDDNGSPIPFVEAPSSKFFNHPRYICITKNGDYVISDSANHCIRIFDSALNFTCQFGSYGRSDGQFRFPYGVASDDFGNLYVADHFNNRVSVFTKAGVFVEHVMTAQDGVTRPKSVAVMNSLLYVTYGGLRANKISVFKLSRDKTGRKATNPNMNLGEFMV